MYSITSIKHHEKKNIDIGSNRGLFARTLPKTEFTSIYWVIIYCNYSLGVIYDIGVLRVKAYFYIISSVPLATRYPV